MGEAGLTWGNGTRLVRMAQSGRLTLEDDRDRVLTLLSVAKGQPMTTDVLPPIEAAAGYWLRGDKALANFRLVFARLPRLEEPSEVDRLQKAADLLDGGLAPRALMKALGFDTAALDKFDPGQPRVPAGNGPTSGRWTDSGNAGASVVEPHVPAPAPRLPILPIAANGPTRPAGLQVIPHPDMIDPLDPANLNTPLSPVEQQLISDTVNTILAGEPESFATLNPHSYRNDPDPDTGAQLPIGGNYTTHYARSPGSVPGAARVVTEDGGSIYYSNNHYKSFYPVDIKRK